MNHTSFSVEEPYDERQGSFYAFPSPKVLRTLPIVPSWHEYQQDRVRHCHDFVELVLVFEGRGVHVTAGRRDVIGAGDVFCIPEGFYHAYEQCEQLVLLNLMVRPANMPLPQLDVAHLPGFSAFYLGKPPSGVKFARMHLPDSELPLIRSLCERMRDDNLNRPPGFAFAILGNYMSVLSLLIRNYQGGGEESHATHQECAKVISFLNRHYQEQVRISDLCHIAHVSKATLMRHFAMTTGTTPRQYQLTLRIGHARKLLEDTSLPISAVASAIGISDANYFSRLFRKTTGLTPLAVRQRVISQSG